MKWQWKLDTNDVTILKIIDERRKFCNSQRYNYSNQIKYTDKFANIALIDNAVDLKNTFLYKIINMICRDLCLLSSIVSNWNVREIEKELKEGKNDAKDG